MALLKAMRHVRLGVERIWILWYHTHANKHGRLTVESAGQRLTGQREPVLRDGHPHN